jgi:ethanolamine utilization protein EutQ (cupin superfamily)
MSEDLGIAIISESQVEKRLQDFSDLLKNIESLDDKKRQLWKEIYENAITDRQNCYVMFMQLFKIIDSKSTEYAVHGKTLTACIERMSKANDQLIKLAELIAKADSNSVPIDPDDMFDRIKGR